MSANPLLVPAGPTYWHVTPAAGLENILAHGLEPRIGERSKMAQESSPAVYLFASLSAAEHAVMSWLGELLPDEPLALLEVNDVEVERSPADYERICFQSIPADKLKAISTDF